MTERKFTSKTGDFHNKHYGMGKRYYCEFCDKSFADNPTNKRNHLKGVFHQRMKKLHYDAFKGLL